MLIDTSKLNDLSLPQKLELLEAITNALIPHENDLTPPVWHKEVLAQREQESHTPESWLSFDEVKKSLSF